MNRLAVLLLIAAASSAALSETPKAPSPAERSIAQARQLIEKNPKNFEAYNALALALSRRARETSDVNYYTQAEDALRQSFAISPDNFDGARIHVWLLLGKHEFAAALEEAKKLNKRLPDDVMTYGFLTDANVELGNYNDAEKSAQMMLDLRPGNLPALTRAAYLRELFGDVDGSLELMNTALESTAPSEVEDRAWILTQMAHLELSVGKAADAENYLQQALLLFPGYHYALGTLAKVRIEQKRYDEAVKLLEQRYDAAPHAENLFDLAEALQFAGRSEDAKKAFAEFEQKSLLESNRGDNSNRELIFYYADYAHQPAKSLEVAQNEFARRHDVFTLDAYAWALHVNGRNREARKEIEEALAVGIRDPKLIKHAGEIALAAGDRAAGDKYLRQAAELNAVEAANAKPAAAHL
ncbi:MAG TPA: tetratricopeptide repeat protein [Silvibacterium sp.]|nr:tetratricopeptide repeat protein [Silvibacterium sp.]